MTIGDYFDRDERERPGATVLPAARPFLEPLKAHPGLQVPPLPTRSHAPLPAPERTVAPSAKVALIARLRVHAAQALMNRDDDCALLMRDAADELERLMGGR